MFNTEKYLTEDNLVEFVREFISTDLILDKQLNPHKFRPDILIESDKTVIEFDGYGHYTLPQIIIKDYEKNMILRDMGYSVIRIPYFVQLNKQVIEFLFPNIKFYRESLYSQGFIDDKVILPASFCSLGIKRFYNDLAKFDFIKDDIINSLENKVIKLKNRQLVYPINNSH